MNKTEVVIAALERAPDIVIPLVQEVPEAILKRRPKPGKWSAHEHACHLAAVHPLMSSRLDLMLAEPTPRIRPYLPHVDDEEDVLLNANLDEALQRFTRDRHKLVERLKTLSLADWERSA